MIKQLPFYEHITSKGGKIYQVGGAVRDKILGRKSKDLDLLITGIPLTTLAQELQAFGKVSEVGESFGIIKLVIDGEELDIAIPRTEKKIGEGHHGFEVVSDHTLSIEEDLMRRDFTINAIAEDADGNLIDPFGGREDIRYGRIKAVNPHAFIEDPLRMLRAVQFAVRLEFVISQDTMIMIRNNAPLIKEISPERVLIEFEKIVKAGPNACVEASKLLTWSRLYTNIFDKVRFTDIIRPVIENFEPNNMAEFIYMLCIGTDLHASEFYKMNLKGTIDTYKEIRAIEIATQGVNTIHRGRLIASEAVRASRAILSSSVPKGYVKQALNEFKEGLYPSDNKELGINGDDLLKLGYKGMEIGTILMDVKSLIYDDRLKNKREDIMKLINENYKPEYK